MVGATTTRSACWPMRTCGTSWTLSKKSLVTGRPDSADHVAVPTNSKAVLVGTTVTSAPNA